MLLVVGLATGFINVMAGGGSMLSVPVLILLGVPGAVANATNRIAILPECLSAIWTFARRGFVDAGLSIRLAMCTLPGCITGAYFAAQIKTQPFTLILAAVMVVILCIMLLPQHNLSGSRFPSVSRKRHILAYLWMVVIGFWGGFIHIGVGFLLMPVLNRVLGLDWITTNSHKVFIVMVYTAAALLVFSTQLQLVWHYGAALAAGTTIGGWMGANFQVRKGQYAVKLFVTVMIVILIVKLIFSAQ